MAVCAACLLGSSGSTSAQSQDESAVLAQVRGTAYVRPLSPVGPTGARRCGFEFLLIGSEPGSGRVVQLKGEFSASATGSGPQDGVYGWSAVIYEGLQSGTAAQAPGRVSMQPVNGMRVEQPAMVRTAGSTAIEYRAPVGADFQVLLSSVVRDRSLKVAFSRTEDSPLVETTLDMDVSQMKLTNNRAVREFNSQVPLAMSRCPFQNPG